MSAWKVVIDESVLHQFAGSPPASRRRLLEVFESLRDNPYRDPGFQTKDAVGRSLSVLASKPFLITYWLDSMEKEIRIVHLESIRY